MATPDGRRREREAMVHHQLAARGIDDPALLDAFREVPREAFVAREWTHYAYVDGPLPIEAGQTISQPYIVAEMAVMAEVSAGERLLEVGCGSGYAAAVLSRVVAQVFTIDRHAALVKLARRRFAALGYANIETRIGDGSIGWPEAAPFDVILAAAAGPDVPTALTAQLSAEGGVLVMPVGLTGGEQHLVRVTRDGETFTRERLAQVRFVPLIGEQGFDDAD